MTTLAYENKKLFEAGVEDKGMSLPKLSLKNMCHSHVTS